MCINGVFLSKYCELMPFPSISFFLHRTRVVDENLASDDLLISYHCQTFLSFMWYNVRAIILKSEPVIETVTLLVRVFTGRAAS